MKADIVVKNCKLVTPEGITREGIAIDDGKILAIDRDSDLPAAERTIDAKENYVIPGVIDTHVHFSYSHPLDIDTRVDSAAAAYGGVTTVSNMMGLEGFRNFAYTDSYTIIFDEWRETQKRNALTDFTIDLVIFSETHIREIPLYAAKYGVFLFKMALINKGLGARELKTMEADDGALYAALKEIAAIGPPARLRLHCENIDIINRLLAIVRNEEKRQDLAAWTDTRPGWVEALDIERAASIARITKAPIFIVHVSSAEGVDAVVKAKAEGVDIIAETTPAYLTLTKDAPLGALGKVIPPLKDKRSIERLWEAINSGVVECIGTDNVSNTKEQKKELWTALPGYSSVESYLPIMLSEGVNKGRITLEKLVEICCINNAKAMGIYPKKGAIRVGSDADLVIIDLNKKVKLSAQTLHQLADFCIWEGWEVKGYPILTMLRGNIIMQDGKLLSDPGVGEYLFR